MVSASKRGTNAGMAGEPRHSATGSASRNGGLITPWTVDAFMLPNMHLGTRGYLLDLALLDGYSSKNK